MIRLSVVDSWRVLSKWKEKCGDQSVVVPFRQERFFYRGIPVSFHQPETIVEGVPCAGCRSELLGGVFIGPWMRSSLLSDVSVCES